MKLHYLILIITAGLALFISYLGFGLMNYVTINAPRTVGGGVILYPPLAAANISSEHVFAMPPDGPPPGIVLKHTNTTQTIQLPNGTIRTFSMLSPSEILLIKAHGDICKLPSNLRNDGVLCLPEDRNLMNKFNPAPPIPIISNH